MRKVLHWVWSLLEVIIIVYVIALTLFVLCKNKYGYTQLGDYSFISVDSIGEKNIQDTTEGDLLIVKNSNDIKTGDVVYYYGVYNDSYIVRSGVISDVTEDDYSALYSIVTNNTNSSVASTRVIGKYANTYANVGSILSVLESKVGFLFLVLLPIMVVFIYQLYEFIVLLKYDDEDGDTKHHSSKKIVTEKKVNEKDNEDKKDKELEKSDEKDGSDDVEIL